MSLLLGAALAAAGALVSFVAGELCARWGLLRWGGYYRYTPYWRERHQIDQEMLPSFPPSCLVEINGDGERGGPAPHPGEQTFRGLVIGGSAAECYLLDQRATWPAVVERILGGPEPLAALGVSRVHLGNVSRAIVPVGQLTFMLRKILPRYRRLDAVLIMVGGADVITWVERGMAPVVPPVEIVLDKIFEQHPEGPWGWRLRRTALWRIASHLNRRLRRPVVAAKSQAWLAKVRRMRAATPGRVDEVPDATPMLDLFEKNLVAIIELARTRAARVIVARQPWFDATPTPDEDRLFWNFGLGRPYREEVSTYLTTRVVDALMRRMDERAAAVATRLGVEQVDVMGAIERSTRTFYDELHFTPEGAEAVGEVVAKAILAGAAAKR